MMKFLIKTPLSTDKYAIKVQLLSAEPDSTDNTLKREFGQKLSLHAMNYDEEQPVGKTPIIPETQSRQVDFQKTVPKSIGTDVALLKDDTVITNKNKEVLPSRPNQPSVEKTAEKETATTIHAKHREPLTQQQPEEATSDIEIHRKSLQVLKNPSQNDGTFLHSDNHLTTDEKCRQLIARKVGEFQPDKTHTKAEFKYWLRQESLKASSHNNFETLKEAFLLGLAAAYPKVTLPLIVDNPLLYKKTVFAAVKLSENVLEFTIEILRDDDEVVKAAVEYSGKALEFASFMLQNNEEIVLARIFHKYEQVPPNHLI